MLLAYPHITRHHQPSQQFYALPADFFPDSSKPTNSPASSQVASSLRNPDKTPLSLGSSEVVSVFDGSETSATSSGLHPEHLGDILDLSPPPELMQSEPWMLANQFTPSSAGRFSHHRESSLSSLGSAGPASPFSHPTSNPHIAVTDSTGDGFHDLQAHDGNSYYQLAKTMPAPQQNMMAAYPSFSLDQPAEMGYPVPVALQTRPRADRTLLPAPDLSVSTSRSHPASVASSIAGDSPATPSLGEPDDDNRRRKAAYGNVPKLDRTMTDIYSDELYSPNFSITSASPSHQARGVMPPSSDVFAQRLQAANSQHLSAAQSPISTTSRERSPFRQGSPLAPMPMADFNAARLGSAHRLREQRKAEQDARILQQQLAMKSDAELPQTISPKDAILEFHESEADSQFPLFPQPQDHDLQQFKGFPSSSKEHAHASALRTSLGPDASQEEMAFQYLPTQSMATVQVPQLYPFIAHAPQNSPSPPRLGSADSQSTESMSHSLPGKPNGASADGGTYTCTYHGCSLRFETPALLQKHKREGHRQAQGLTGSRRVEIGMTTSLLNSQAGPHRCDRINPSTGKPCNTVFSRPYDLTRHEDTIHNGRKQKVRCNLCTEEKTFSRADALTRHYRVCHPDVDFPGKHRRRVQNA